MFDVRISTCFRRRSRSWTSFSRSCCISRLILNFFMRSRNYRFTSVRQLERNIVEHGERGGTCSTFARCIMILLSHRLILYIHTGQVRCFMHAIRYVSSPCSWCLLHSGTSIPSTSFTRRRLIIVMLAISFSAFSNLLPTLLDAGSSDCGLKIFRNSRKLRNKSECTS
jgi:hypothetical protein